MLRVEAVTEGMADHRVGHDALMPGIGKTAQSVVSTRRLEDTTHTSRMPIVPHSYKTTAGLRAASLDSSY
jgi:hypothetical protein